MSVMGLRERKKLETRRALVHAALHLVQTRGLDDVTVDDIAAEAGVSPRTFFNHFASKEDAVLGTHPETLDALRAELAGRPLDEPPLDAIRAAFVAVARTTDDAPHEWGSRLALVESEPQLHARFAAAFANFEQSLEAVIAERLGDDAPAGYAALVVACALAAARVALRGWQASGGDRPFSEFIDDTFARLADGLASPVPPVASVTR